MGVQADRIEQLIAESVARHAESVEYRTLVAVGAMILVSCLSTLISFRTLSSKLEAMNAANDGTLRGGVHDAGDEETEGHFGSKELRVSRHYVDEPARSGGSVGHTRATRRGSAGAVPQHVRASSKGGAQAPGRPGRTPPADKPVDVAARSPSHHKSRESAKRPDAATPRSGKVQKESRDSFERRMPGTSDSSAKRPDAATPRSGKVQKESRDSFKRRMPGTSDSNGTGGLSDAVRPRSPSDPLPPFHTILRASLTKRALSQPVERREAEEMRLQELRKLAQRGDSLDGVTDGMVSARAGSAVRAHSEHDRGFQEPIGPKRSASDEKAASDEKTLLSAVANSRGTSPRRVESASGTSPRRRGAPDEKILLPAENSRGASPRRGSASPQRSFSELLNASSGSLFYASIVDEKLRSKHAETTCSTQAEQVQAN